jgi:hypothetical protein
MREKIGKSYFLVFKNVYDMRFFQIRFAEEEEKIWR